MRKMVFGALVVLSSVLVLGCAPRAGSALTTPGSQGAYLFVLVNGNVASPRAATRLAAGVASGLRRHGYTTAVISDRSQYVQGHYLLELQSVSVRRIPFAQILDVTYEVTAGSPAPLHRGMQSRASHMSPARLVRGIALLIVEDIARGMSARAL